MGVKLLVTAVGEELEGNFWSKGTVIGAIWINGPWELLTMVCKKQSEQDEKSGGKVNRRTLEDGKEMERAG